MKGLMSAKLRVTAVCALFLFGICSVGPGLLGDNATTAYILSEAEPAYTQEQALQWLEIAKSTLEQVSQRKFDSEPVVECVSREALAKVLEKEFLATLNRHDPSGADFLNPSMSEIYASLFAGSMLGKYSLEDEKILLVPGNLKPVADLAGYTAEAYPGIVKILLAHELTHALQDQEVDLGAQLASISDREAVPAFNAAMEGQAVLFHEQVGKALGLEKSVEQVNYLMPGGGLLSEKMPQVAAERASSGIYQKISYDYGPAYMRKQFEAGGVEATWQAMAAAPVDLNDILTARAVSHQGKTYIERLEGLEEQFAEGQWQVQTLALDKDGMARQFDHLPAEDKALFLANIKSSSSRIAMQERKGIPASVIATVFTFEDPAFVPKLSKYMDLQLAQMTKKFSDSGLEFETRKRLLMMPSCGAVTLNTLSMHHAETDQSFEQHFILMHGEKVCLQIVMMGLPAPTQEQYRDISNRLGIEGF